MTYIIVFLLGNGDEIRIKVSAANQAEALKKIEQTPEIIERMDGEFSSSFLKRVEIIPDSVDEEDDDDAIYSIQEVAGEKWLFRHKFPHFYARVINGDEPLTDFSWGENCDELTAATALRKAADFIIKYRESHDE